LSQLIIYSINKKKETVVLEEKFMMADSSEIKLKSTPGDG
jgi:hypothetical protein